MVKKSKNGGVIPFDGGEDQWNQKRKKAERGVGRPLRAVIEIGSAAELILNRYNRLGEVGRIYWRRWKEGTLETFGFG